MTLAALTPEQAREAERCFTRVVGAGLTLTAAVDYALANQVAGSGITLRDALDQFMAAKEGRNLRAATLATLRARLGRMVRELGAEQKLVRIGAEALRPLIFRHGSGSVNAESDYRALTNLFNWAVLQGHLAASPMAKIPTIKLERGEPSILPLVDVYRLLFAAELHKGGLTIPYLVLGLFCAVRPAEIVRLTWADVDLTAKTVTIGAGMAKMRARRIVQISDNAAAWLARFHVEQKPFCPAGWWREWVAVRRVAGFGPEKPWVADVLRHTGISMHLAQWEHEGKTALWAGNSADVIQRHYRALVKKEDASAFWDIWPAHAQSTTGEAGNVLAVAFGGPGGTPVT